MPLPKPKTGEKQQDFISRCMSNPTMKKEFPEQKQRLAVCFSQWRRFRGKMIGKWNKMLEVIKKVEKIIEKQKRFYCECLDCGYKMWSDKHCRDIKCPKCGGPMRRAERSGVGNKKIEKAKWTRAYINDLPDAAFALILPGGHKDEEGKTVPRSLRILPHHNMSVKNPNENSSVDIPHLRNALARLPQVKEITEAQRKRAYNHLARHAKALLPSWKED